MKNRIIYTSDKEIAEVRKCLKQNDKTYVVEIEGIKCLYLSDYLNLISDLFQFPMKVKGLDGYNDWMKDLSWIGKNQIVIIIYNFQQFLQKDVSSKTAILEDFYEIILPWWESEVVNCVVGGEKRRMVVYLIQ